MLIYTVNTIVDIDTSQEIVWQCVRQLSSWTLSQTTGRTLLLMSRSLAKT